MVRTVVALLVAPLGTPLVVWVFFLSARLLGIGTSARVPASELVDRANLHTH